MIGFPVESIALDIELDMLSDFLSSCLNLAKKWKEFGWDVKEINGHNIQEILDGLQSNLQPDKPRAIIANTVKGKGFSFTENNNSWHHNVITEKMYLTAIDELKTNRV